MALLFDANGEKVDYGSQTLPDQAGTHCLWFYIDSATSRETILQWNAASGIALRGDAGGLFECFVSRVTSAVLIDATNTNFAAYGTARWLFLAMRWDPAGVNGDQELYMGDLVTPAAEPSSYSNQQVGSGTLGGTGTMSYGGHPTVTNRPFLGKIAHVSRFNRYLSVAEIHTMQFQRKPLEGCVLFNEYGFNGTGTQTCFAGSGLSGTVTGATPSDHVANRPVFCASVDDYSYNISSGAFSIAAAGGTYALTGAAAGLLGHRKIAATAGSYSLSGAAATFQLMRQLTAGSGSYSLSGANVGLLRGALLSAASGSYALSGVAALLLKNSRVAINSGAYALTGSTVDLIFTPGGSFVIAAGAGAYNVTGTDIGLLATRVLGAGGGVYALTGQPATLRPVRRIAVNAGNYAVAGQNVSTIANRIIPIAGGGYLITGQNITLVPPIGSTQPGHVTARVYEAHHVRARISKGSSQ
jgi:hypothetical protein